MTKKNIEGKHTWSEDNELYHVLYFIPQCDGVKWGRDVSHHTKFILIFSLYLNAWTGLERELIKLGAPE